MSVILIMIGLFFFAYGVSGIINHYPIETEQSWELYTPKPSPNWTNEIVLDSISQTISSIYGKYRLDYVRILKIVVIDGDTFFRDIKINEHYLNDTLIWINPQVDYFTSIP